MTALSVVDRARLYVEKIPPAISGQGGHDATFHVACVLVQGFALDGESAFQILREFNQRCSPPWTPAQLVHKIRSAQNSRSTKPLGHLLGETPLGHPAPIKSLPLVAETTPARVLVDEKLRAEVIAKNGYGLADLWEASPYRVESNEPMSDFYLAQMFPGDPLLCCGLSNSQFDTRLLSEWMGEFQNLQLIVPSPMTARTGRTKEGKLSAHSLEATGKRRFLVIEFDHGTTDEQAAIVLHLAAIAPLILSLHSGGKSIHSWFLVQDVADHIIEGFFKYCRKLGCDKATWCQSQFVRMPDGVRPNGKRQPVYYFNPNILTKEKQKLCPTK